MRSLISVVIRCNTGEILSKRAVDAVFQGLFLFTDIRGILRESAPDHVLNADEQEQTKKILEKLEKQIEILREELIR